MSIRARLTIGVVLLLLATFAVLGAVMARTTRGALIDQVDARVLTAADRPPFRGGTRGRGPDGGGGPDAPGFRDERHGPPPTPEEGDAADDGSYERPVAFFVLAPDGMLLAAFPSGYPDEPDPPPLLPAPASPAFAKAAGKIVTLPAVDGSLRYRVLLKRDDGGLGLATAAPLSAVDKAVASILRMTLVAEAAALGVAAAAIWSFIRHELRPVDRMIDTAAAIAAGDLGRRVPAADPRTELGRLGAALNEMLGQIERAVRAREASEARLRRFLADAAHELRTPLTSLRGYAELYRQGALTAPDAVGNAMRRIESEGARMARLVDDLLLLARLDQQRGVEREPVDLVAVAREAAADFAAVDPDRPFAVELAPAAAVRGDRVRLRQIVDNLLTNARVHTGPGTPISLAVRQDGSDVVLVVADEGPGIPTDAQPRIFERFWRADPARGRATGGTGLGLAIVASLVAAHGGTIALTSAPGHGTTFTVRLPRA